MLDAWFPRTQRYRLPCSLHAVRAIAFPRLFLYVGSGFGRRIASAIYSGGTDCRGRDL